MYIPHQHQQAIYQDKVNDGLRRSERRRMLEDLEHESDAQTRTRSFGITLTALVRSMRRVAART